MKQRSGQSGHLYMSRSSVYWVSLAALCQVPPSKGMTGPLGDGTKALEPSGKPKRRPRWRKTKKKKGARYPWPGRTTGSKVAMDIIATATSKAATIHQPDP
ncbi:hypothetical protein JZ751_013265 [Albula glossodonta]|uniref:Uncharacterized protein n=1 Tax=Albula glossodonta TaxID=121402 RepID=A0A8T2NUJ1_9TELE|nr:hypothetical protein JZ751_013265 [Albula glossodonta]